MVFGIIYVSWRPDGRKVYVGKTIRTLPRRWQAHVRAASRGNPSAFACALRKYGAGSMLPKQIDYADSEEELNRKEIFWIRALGARTMGYNMTDGGEGIVGYKHSAESLQKIQAASLGKKYAKGHHHTDEQRRQISRANMGNHHARGYHHTNDARRRIGLASKGNKNSVGRCPPEAERLKMREAQQRRRQRERTIFIAK